MCAASPGRSTAPGLYAEPCLGCFTEVLLVVRTIPPLEWYPRAQRNRAKAHMYVGRHHPAPLGRPMLPRPCKIS